MTALPRSLPSRPRPAKLTTDGEPSTFSHE